MFTISFLLLQHLQNRVLGIWKVKCICKSVKLTNWNFTSTKTYYFGETFESSSTTIIFIAELRKLIPSSSLPPHCLCTGSLHLSLSSINTEACRCTHLCPQIYDKPKTIISLVSITLLCLLCFQY